MKSIFFLFLLSWQFSYSQSTNFKLTAEERTDSFHETHFVLKLKNLTNKNHNLLLARDYNFYGISIPNIEFVAETFVNGKWRKFKDRKTIVVDFGFNKISENIVELKPNEEIIIGEFINNHELDYWFNFLDNANIRLYFIYKINIPNKKDEDYQLFINNKIKELEVTSNKIEYQHINKLKQKEYLEHKKFLINYSFSLFFEKYYTYEMLINNKKITKCRNQYNDDILEDHLKGKKHKLVNVFVGNSYEHKTRFMYRILSYEVEGKLYYGVYLNKDKSFIDIETPPSYVFTDFLYKD